MKINFKSTDFGLSDFIGGVSCGVLLCIESISMLKVDGFGVGKMVGLFKVQEVVVASE